MYVDINGKKVENKLLQIKDTVDFNFSIDSMDLPLSRFGVPQRMGFSNKSELFDGLNLIFSDLQTQEYLNGVNLDGIELGSGSLEKVTLSLSYKGSSLSIGVNL